MKRVLVVFVTVGILVFACGKKVNPALQDEISGAYVREYSFKVVNPETGAEIGMRSIRDTIFIRPLEEKYEVSNNKWRLNDYDKEGWQSMEHAEDRSISTFQAIFNSIDRSLDSESMPHLFLDLEKEQLYKDKSRGKPYQKSK